MRVIVVSLFCMMLVACGGLPDRKTERGDDMAYLAISNLEGTATVQSNTGIMAVVPESYDSEDRLPIQPGRHKVTVTKDGKIVYSRELFVASGTTRTITLDQ